MTDENHLPIGRASDSELPPLDRPALFGLVAAKLIIHLPGLVNYGYFRDELYFLDCGRHLSWGYADHAPLAGLYAKIGLLLGGSLPAIRFLPILAGAALVLLTLLLTRQLGGGRFAQRLAGLCALVPPVYLIGGSILTMNAFEPLFWMGCLYILIRIIRTGDHRLWLWFGALAGLGLENKHSTLLFGFAVAVALLLSRERREIIKPWLWLGGAAALLLFLPNLIWQFAHDFPTLELLANVRESGKNIILSPADFVVEQIMIMHPATFPIWLAGLASLMVGRQGRFRMLGWIYLVLLVTMIVLKAKNYYLAPIYPMLMAAGAVAVAGWLEGESLARGRSRAKAAVLAFIILTGAITAPMALPLLAPEQHVAYTEMLGLDPPKTEVAHVGPLPQVFGDQFGWEELVAEVAEIYWSLPAEERARTGIFASNYGEAGAINLFGPEHGLPPAICAHQNHYFWGPREFDGDTLIWLQWPREPLEKMFRSVDQAGEHFHPWGMAEENRPIYLCRGLIIPLTELWGKLKLWN